MVYNPIGIDMSHIHLFDKKNLIINILVDSTFAIYK